MAAQKRRVYFPRRSIGHPVWDDLVLTVKGKLEKEFRKAKGKEEFENWITFVNQQEPTAGHIREILENDLVHQVLEGFVNGLLEKKYIAEKSSEEARNLRLRGNARNNPVEAFDLYSQALHLAPTKPENEADRSEYCLALGSRSVALAGLKRFKEAILDIEEALQTECPAEYHEALSKSRDICLREISDKRTLADRSEAATSREGGPEGSGSVGTKLALESSTQESTEETPRNTKIQVHFNDKVGHHIVAKDSIGISEAVLTEDPFSHWLNPNRYYSNCYHCLKEFYVYFIVCQTCTAAHYCSRSCADNAWKEYHKLECPQMQTFVPLGMLHLAIRTIMVVGVQDALRLHYEQSRVQRRPTTQLNTKDKYEHYINVLWLDDHCRQRSPSSQWHYYALGALTCLLADHLPAIAVNQGQKYALGALITKHLMQIDTCFCPIGKIERVCTNELVITRNVQEDVGAGIYPFLYLFNHSCGYDVKPLFNGRSLTLLSVNTFEPGVEIRRNYGTYYRTHTRQDRRAFLRKTFFFEKDCDCALCSTGEDYNGIAYSCTVCHAAFFINEDGTGHCSNCENISGVSELLEKEDPVHFMLDCAKTHYLKLQFKEAISLYKKTMILAKVVLWPKHTCFTYLHHNLAACYNAKGEYRSSLLHLRRNYDIMKAQSWDDLSLLRCILNMANVSLKLFQQSKRPRELMDAKKYFESASSIFNRIRNQMVHFISATDGAISDLELLSAMSAKLMDS